MEIQNINPQGFERASDKLTAEQLDRPVDEVVEEAPSESVPETPVESEPEPTVETPETPVETVEEEEAKVPRSRFLTMHQRAVEAEKTLRQFEAERAERSEPQAPVNHDQELHQFYVDTFGEGEMTEKLYQNELSRLTSIEERAAERAFERFNKMGQEQEEVINQRVESFDKAFEELSIVSDHDFTDDEQVALLDIVEEYSPKDADGKLLGDYLLPLDKAWDIYQVKNQPIVQAKRNERNQVASLQGARSEGGATTTSDADWQPGERRWWNKV